MSLAAKLADAKKATVPPFEQWVQNLNDADRAAVEAAAGDTLISTSKLLEILREEGGKVGKDALLEFRRARGYVTR